MNMYYLNTNKNNTINFFQNYLLLKHIYTIWIRPFCIFGSYTVFYNILIYQNTSLYSISPSLLHKFVKKMATLVTPKVVEIYISRGKMNSEHLLSI